MSRLLPAVVAAAAALLAIAGNPEAATSTRGFDEQSHWHGGPFFEYWRSVGPNPVGADREGRLRTFWAFRPFYSQVRAPETTKRDFLWPVATCHSREDALWWRAFFLAYGDDRDGLEPSWSFNLLPIVFCGSDRRSGAYGGLFPVYGQHPHFLLMDNWRFCLWPVWMDYDVTGIHHGAVLWPLITWKENDTMSAGVWPLFSHSRLRESDHWYFLWPIATWARYDEDRDTSGAGSSWMFWPVYGNVSRARERQHLVLPPFFSYTRTPHVLRWRLPWPLVDVELGTKRNRVSVWPFYEYLDGFQYPGKSAEGVRGRVDIPPPAVEGPERPSEDHSSSRAPEERTRRYLWMLVEDIELETDTTYESRFNFFPFFTRERRYVKSKDGTRRETASFTRIWPFWRSETENGFTERRVLDLIPVRHSEGFDRNWAAFWTFWTSEGAEGGPTEHSLFWSIIDWKQE